MRNYEEYNLENFCTLAYSVISITSNFNLKQNIIFGICEPLNYETHNSHTSLKSNTEQVSNNLSPEATAANVCHWHVQVKLVNFTYY